MEKLSHIEFMKVYKTKIEPFIIPYDKEFKSLKKSARIKASIVVILAIAIGGIGLYYFKTPIIPMVSFILGIIFFSMAFKGVDAFKIRFKRDIGSKVLSLCGKVGFSDDKSAVCSSDIKMMGLFPSFTDKNDDDIIAGEYKGCKFVVNECRLTHIETKQQADKEVKETKTDFKGLVFKVQMNKNFLGKTVVGLDFKVRKMSGFDEVKLESIQFMRGRKIYSTDQIEARYILTTTFMEKLDELGKVFWKHRWGLDNPVFEEKMQHTEKLLNVVNSSSDLISKGVSTLMKTQMLGVSAAFIGGYMYVFIPTCEGDNLFEIGGGREKGFFEPDIYYEIYSQMWSFFALIDYMKLDEHLGL